MERIRQLRTELGVSQAKLAVTAGMDPATLNRLEQGKGNPNLRTLQRVADALGVEVTELLGKAPAPTSQQPTLNGELEERRAHIIDEAAFNAAEKWREVVSNPDTRPSVIEGVVGAALTLFDELMDLHDEFREVYGTEASRANDQAQRRALRLAGRLLGVANAAEDRLPGQGRTQEEQYKRRREQIREWTRHIEGAA